MTSALLLLLASLPQAWTQPSGQPRPSSLPEGTTVHRDLAYHQSELLEAALKAAGVPVTFYTVKGAGHGRFNDPKVPELTREFLATRLKGSPVR